MSSPGATTRSASATAAGDFAIASAKAKCPNGQQATGGGFRAPTFTGAVDADYSIYESRKVGQRSWRVSGQIFESTALLNPRTLTAFVYCSSTAPSTKSRSASVTSDAGSAQFLAADARCKGGKKAHAGGFRGPPPNVGSSSSSYFPTDSYRADKKTWRSRMRVFDPGVSFTSYVYCADEEKPAASLGSTTSATPGTLHTAISANCKRGTKPAAGGFSQPVGTLPNNFFRFFFESAKSGKSWRVSAQHLGSNPTTLNSIAYCA